jgi:hypothetical protein
MPLVRVMQVALVRVVGVVVVRHGRVSAGLTVNVIVLLMNSVLHIWMVPLFRAIVQPSGRRHGMKL